MIRAKASLTVALLFAAVCGPGCSIFQNSTSPNATTTDTFSGTLNQNSSVIFTFSVTQSGAVAITLTALTPSSSTPVGLGIGPASGTTSCTTTSATSSAVAGTTPQLTTNEDPGTYCVKVYDVGGLTAAASVTVTVDHS